MTTGIYLLKFDSGLEYVGQAIDVEKRWEQHKSNMLTNKAATKMQQAFKKSGLPSFELVEECHRDNLDTLENYYIQMIRPALNTVVTGMFTDKELDAIERNRHLLHMSTPQLLDYFDEVNVSLNVCLEQAKALQSGLEEVEAIRTEREAAIGAVRELNLLKTLHEKELDALHSEIELLHSKLEWAERPWWKKIF